MTERGRIMLIVYVEDIIIIADDIQDIDDLRNFLKEQFHNKDLGSLRFLGGLRLPSLRRKSICPKGCILWMF